MQKQLDSIACAGLNHVQIYAGTKGNLSPLRALMFVENLSETLSVMLNDLRCAFRQLLKNSGFTAVAVLTLALGIGANTAIFRVVDGVLLKPLHYDQPGQLVQVWEAPTPGKQNPVSPGVFVDWKQQSVTFDSLAAFISADLNLTGIGEPEHVNGLRMSANGLNVLRALALLGRTFAPAGDKHAQHKALLL